MKNLLKSGWELVQENRRAYIAMNAVYYGLTLLCMVYVAFDQSVQKALLEQIGAELAGGPLAIIRAAYVNAEVLKAIGLTFATNLFVGSFITITIPSLIIPFSGLLMGVIRAVLWGLMLSPADPSLRLAMIPHSVTLILEGQGYVLAMLAVYLQGRAFLQPRSFGITSHWRGYLEGLKRTGKLYVLITLVLAASAAYEVIEVVLMIRLSR